MERTKDSWIIHEYEIWALVVELENGQTEPIHCRNRDHGEELATIVLDRIADGTQAAKQWALAVTGSNSPVVGIEGLYRIREVEEKVKLKRLSFEEQVP